MKHIPKPQEETTTQRHAVQRKSGADPDGGELEQHITRTPAMAAQRKKLQGLFGGAVQRAKGEEEELPMQGKFATVQRVGGEEEELPAQGKLVTVQRVGGEEEELPAQGKFVGQSAAQLKEDAASPNRTGLPNNLKSGVESLSGMSMDHVRVHYNSPEPASLNALAYAQGSDIHVAPGQEQHLPHEAWHVVQQAQGRVKPTTQMKEGVPVNDDRALEHEADVMGAKALQMRKGKGSHGKNLFFKVTTVTIKNSVTNQRRYVNANYEEDLGKVPTHGAGPAQKTYADALVIANGVANLGANESIENITWNHFTRG
jgi:hypothetical protein